MRSSGEPVTAISKFSLLAIIRPKMRVLSGIQPTGEKHLGNYVGAIRRWVERAARGGCLPSDRRPARDHAPPGSRRPARGDARPDGAAHRLRARSGRVHALRPEPRSRASAPRVGARVHDAVRRAAAHAAVSGEIGGAQELLRRHPHLPRAAGRRHPPLPGRPRPGRRGPAPAPRARARHRPALQPALRRDVHRSRGNVRGGGREDHGPAGARDADVDVARQRARHRQGARSTRHDPQEAALGRHRLGRGT